MIKVAGHWELTYMTPIQEAFYWDYVLRDFEISEWLMTPISGIRHNQHLIINLNEFHTTTEMLDSCAELPRVFLEPRTSHQNPDTIWLHEFVHPESCTYVFGSGAINPTLAHTREQDVVVSIKSVNDGGVFWGNQTLAITLYDRMVKSWQ
jgi:hypothetical protein